MLRVIGKLLSFEVVRDGTPLSCALFRGLLGLLEPFGLLERGLLGRGFCSDESGFGSRPRSAPNALEEFSPPLGLAGLLDMAMLGSTLCSRISSAKSFGALAPVGLIGFLNCSGSMVILELDESM